MDGKEQEANDFLNINVFALLRGAVPPFSGIHGQFGATSDPVGWDFAAITRLCKVRNEDIQVLRKELAAYNEHQQSIDTVLETAKPSCAQP